MVQVMCESCAPFDIAEELCADIKLLEVDAAILALVAATSRKVNEAGGCLKITSMQEILACVDGETASQERGWQHRVR